MNISLLIDEITLGNISASDIKKVRLKPELIVITKRQVLEIAIIAQVAAIDKETIRQTLANIRNYRVSNTDLAEELQERLINKIKK